MPFQSAFSLIAGTLAAAAEAADAAGARHNSGAQLRNVALAHLSGDGHREQAFLAGFRQAGQIRFDAGLDPAITGLNAGAQLFDVAGAGIAAWLLGQSG